MRLRVLGCAAAALWLGVGCTALLGPERQNAADGGAPDLAGPAGESRASASESSILATPGSVIADGSSNSVIRVTVLDSNGAPVVGEPVSLMSSGTHQTLSPPSGITNGQGIFNATLSSTEAELKTVTATVAGFTLQTTVQFTPGSAQSGHSTLVVAPASIAAGGATAAITVTVEDVNNNPVENQAVTLTATGTGNTITPSSGMTNASGVFSATISSTRAEAKMVSAQIGTFNLNQPLTVVAGVPSASMSTVVASPANGLPANGSAKSTITVTVRDAAGNLASGVAVTLGATGSNNTFTPASGSSDASGVLSSALTTTTVETKTVTAVAGGVTITQQPTVVFDACPTTTAITTNGVSVLGSTTSGSNEYHPVCALPSDAMEKVYGFSLAAASSVLVDRSSSFAGAVTDLRAAGASCSADSGSYGCTTGQYLYCPNVAIGNYQVVVDGVSSANGSFNLAVTAPGTTKGTNSYGVVTRAETASSFSSILGQPMTTEILTTPATGLLTGGYATTALPFDFKYFGTSYTSGSTLTAFRSGYLAFGSSTVDTFTNACLPATGQLPSDVILPFWGRLASRGSDVSPPSGRGRILVRTQGAAGSRTHTIEWNQFDGVDTTASMATECIVVSFQVILYEATQQIEFRYNPAFRNTCGTASTDPTFPLGGLATIGLRSGTTTVLTEPVTCSTVTNVLGTCAGGTAPNACSPNKSYMFVPQSASCP